MIPAKTVRGSWLLVLSVGAIIISVAFIGVAYVALSPKEGGTMYGTLFINEAGMSNSTAGYHTAPTTRRSRPPTGTARSSSPSCRGQTFCEPPRLDQQLHISVNQISMTIGGHPVVMPWEDNDTVWAGQYDNNYIASWGPSAPSYELRGRSARRSSASPRATMWSSGSRRRAGSPPTTAARRVLGRNPVSPPKPETFVEFHFLDAAALYRVRGLHTRSNMQVNAGKLQILTVAAMLVLISGGIAAYAQGQSAPSAGAPAADPADSS